VFAVQICKLLGANPIAIVGGKDKSELVRRLGAEAIIDRNEFANLNYKPPETPERCKLRMEDTKRFGKRIRELTGGKDVDVVFEHVGQQTFPTSVFVAKRFGKIVICGATTGFNLEFDVRHLWMRQKQILGSHFANAYQAERANQLVHEGKIKPVLDQVFGFKDTAHAHALMAANKHKGKIGIAIQCAASAQPATEAA
jgi:crotonyl-CoA carboxylase/reductase